MGGWLEDVGVARLAALSPVGFAGAVDVSAVTEGVGLYQLLPDRRVNLPG